MRFCNYFTLLALLSSFHLTANAQVTNSLPGRVLVKLTPDYLRPVVYALNAPSGTNAGTLLALNATNGTVVNEIAVGINPTDMAVTPAGDSLYVINAGSRSISKVDLTSFTVQSTKTISTPSSYSSANPLYLVANNSGTVYFTDGAWGPEIYSFDYASGTETMILNTGGNQFPGAGGLVLSKNASTLYIWQQYGWSAGSINSSIVSYSISNNTLTTLSTGPNQNRDPVNTPIFLDAAERWVFNKVQKVSATNTSVLLTQFTDNIYGISLDGSIAFGPTEVFNAQTGISITNLPFSTTVQSLSGDQKKLFRYNPSTASVVVYDMAGIASLSGPAIMPTPANGSVVAQAPTNLVWSPSATALSYDVYFGTSQAAVAAATTASPLYLGRTTGTGISPGQQLSAGNTYYWRVDTIGFNATNQGPTWSFTLSQVAINPTQLSVGGITGYNPANVSLSVTSAVAATSSVAWSAAVTGSPWMTLSATSGTTPSTVTVSFNTAAFAAGTYTNNIEFTVGGSKTEVPVTLNIAALNIVKMVADLQRPYIYALQPPALSGQNGQLLFINTTTGNIDKTLPIGINPVDLTIHYGEQRLYIASWTENATYVVDLNSQNLLPPLQLGTDVYKINAGKPGQIITEGENQWVYANLINTANGATIVNAMFREGDGKFDPTGRYYYHGDNNISGAGITKYDMSANTFASVAGAGGHYYYGSRNVVMSADGTRIFWTGAAYDANLNDLGYLGEEIYATTAHGDLALGTQHVFNSHNGQTLYTWPFSATVMAVSGDQQKVFLYNSASKQIVSIPMSSIASVPGPGLNPVPTNGAIINPPLPQLSWTVNPLAWSYQVYMGPSAAAVAAADTNSPLYLGTTTSNSFPLSTAVIPGFTYYWRVDSVGFPEVTTGAVWSFTVSALTVAPQTLSLSGVAGLPILPQTISLTAPLPTTWNLTVAQPWMSASVNSGVTPSSVTLTFNTSNLTTGTYTNQLTFTANGLALRMPVTVQLFNLSASKMVADPNRNYIYVLHPGSGSLPDAFLLFLNADTGVVEKVIPIGINPTDMAVNRFEDRLYISNWQHNQTHVVDLKTQTELTPLSLGTDIYKVNAGRAGRIVTEGEDQWIGVNVVDTGTGAVVGSFPYPERSGDGEADPSGNVYYHCDWNISNAHVHKFMMTNDSPVEVAGSAQHPYGTRNLVLSPDGTRLFWNGYEYDTNLNELGPLGTEIYSCNSNGSIAFGASQAFDTLTRLAICNLPVSSSVSVVDRSNQKFWYYANGAIGSVPMTVIASPSITQQPATNTGVLAGNSVYLSVSAIGLAPLSYQWTFSGTNIPGATNYFLSLPSVQSSQAGSYQVVVANPFGSVTSSVANVTLLYPPVITNQSPSMHVLAGQPISLSVAATGSGPLSYTWKFQNSIISGATSSNLVINNAQQNNEGIYQAVVANPVGSVASAVISVRVDPAAPTIVANPVSLVRPASSNATFVVTAIGSQPLAYQWFFNNAPIPGATAAQFSLNGIQSGNSGNYSVIVSNAMGSVTSASATLTVTPLAPYFTTQPIGGSFSGGSSYTLTGIANGSLPIGYQWQHNSTNIPGATQSSLTLTGLSTNDSGPYVLIASNIAGTTNSSVVQLTVLQNPTLGSGLTNQIVDAGSNVVLSVNVLGASPIGYSWRLNGQPIASTNSTLSITNIQPSQSGFYSVTITNSSGSISSTCRVSVLGQASSLVAWGDNSGGQLNVPSNLADAVAVAGGDYHTLVLRHDGTLLAWGYDGNGQTNAPTNAQPFVAIASGTDHCLAITESGSLVGWGRNDFGQCNIPAGTSNGVLAVAAGDAHSLALLGNGSVIAWGNNSYGQSSVSQLALSGVTAIAAGRVHSLALRTNGTVVGWGYNAYGQASPPAGLSNVVAIAAGYLHSAALLSNKTVVVWGDNSFGQTNVPAGLSNVVAIVAGDFNTSALLANGTIVSWGDDTYGQTDVPGTLTNAVTVASGNYHGLALVPTAGVLLPSASPNGLVLKWTGNATLQWAPSPTGPFQDVPMNGICNCYTNTGMTGMKFFRLRR